MNHTATSKEELLTASRKLAADEGFQALNMRAVAKACGVSVGCVYGYFPSKAELVSAVVAEIWERIFHMDEGMELPADFRACIRWVFERIRSGSAEYPAFFQKHAEVFVGSEKAEGRRVMGLYLAELVDRMTERLGADPAVRQERFDETFTRRDLAEFIFGNLLTLGMRQAEDCDYLVRLTEKLVY